jgi:RNA polymerase primary sigma factor
LLPVDCEGGPELDDILAALERAGVPVVAAPDPEPLDDFGGEDDPLRVYVREVAKVPPLSRDAEMALARLKTEAAEIQLVEANLRPVIWIAKRYADSDHHVLDLIKEGNTGLMHAVQSFDPGLGYRFSTYATWCARRAILKKLRT